MKTEGIVAMLVIALALGYALAFFTLPRYQLTGPNGDGFSVRLDRFTGDTAAYVYNKRVPANAEPYGGGAPPAAKVATPDPSATARQPVGQPWDLQGKPESFTLPKVTPEVEAQGDR